MSDGGGGGGGGGGRQGPPDIEGMTTIKVDNLRFDCTSEELRDIFQGCVRLSHRQQNGAWPAGWVPRPHLRAGAQRVGVTLRTLADVTDGRFLLGREPLRPRDATSARSSPCSSKMGRSWLWALSCAEHSGSRLSNSLSVRLD